MAAMVAAGSSPLIGGVQAMMRLTPATFAVTTAHVRRGHHGVTPAGHITADAVDRDILVPQHDSGQGLDFDILQSRALRLGKVPHLPCANLISEIACSGSC